MSQDNNKSPFEIVSEGLTEAEAQNLALRMVCATLMVEIALQNPSPTDKLNSMSAVIQGIADGTAKQAGTDLITLAITKTIEEVCEGAEAVLASRLSRE